uniref:Dynein axonemal assembly factor 1 homolog n=1 Tax=Timema monikensis TaxID=170555 RepID=A0A7R9HM67_9NEOP|nr:unnamed protein product [Timema monikensis]
MGESTLSDVFLDVYAGVSIQLYLWKSLGLHPFCTSTLIKLVESMTQLSSVKGLDSRVRLDSTQMSIIHDSLEPGVIDNAMILKAMDEQGPKGEAGRLAKEEGRSMEEVDKIRLEFLNILKIDHLWIMTSLVKLQLGNNIIEKIENLEMLVNLRELDLSFNNIEKIENLEALVKLEILLLFENRISVIENITTLTKMMIFSIGNNKIDSWDNVIYLRQFSALKSLNMAGNPCAEKLNFRSYVCAFLPNLTYYEYKMITLTERNDACQEYSSSLEKLEEREAKETQEKEEQEKAKKELEYHMEAYVEGLDTDELFITMFKDDKEGLALLEMNDDAKDLQKIFREQMMEVIEQLFSIGLRQHKVREEEMTLFRACVNKAKEENRLNSQHLMEEFLVKKAGVFHNIHELAKTVEDQDEEDLSRQIDEMQKHTDSYHEFCQKTWYDLMEAELTLFEQLEETNGNFERNLNDLVGSFIEQAQSLFTHIRNLEQNFSEQLNECATHYLTNLNVRLEDRNLNVPLELIPGDNINLKVKELMWALQAAMRKASLVMKEVTRCVGNRLWNEQLQKLCERIEEECMGCNLSDCSRENQTPAVISTLKKPEGGMTTCWEESARLLMDVFLLDDNLEDWDEENEREM